MCGSNNPSGCKGTAADVGGRSLQTSVSALAVLVMDPFPLCLEPCYSPVL